MINVIFTLSILAPLSDEQKLAFMNSGCVWVEEIPEMPHKGTIIPIQAYVPNAAVLTAIKSTLDAIDTRGAVEVIGVWNEDGSFYDPVNFPFNINLYAEYLRPIDDGNGGFRQPTVEEAAMIQINRFSGMADRVLV